MLFPGPPSAGLPSHLQLQAVPLLQALPPLSRCCCHSGTVPCTHTSKAVVLVVFKLHASVLTHIFKINLKGFLKLAVKLT